MMQWIVAYISAAIIFGVLDALWLNWAGPNLYRPIIGEVMADKFNVGAAAAFYFLYLLGMMWFAVKPGLASGEWTTALLNGVLLGALCYATYDLTSQAVLKVWATKLSVIDIMWGAFATGVASAVATFVALRFTN